MALPNYEHRFRPAATEALVRRRDRLNELPVGATLRIRDVVFHKDTRRAWSNDFRSGMTAGDVASVLDGTETIALPGV